MTLGMGPKFMSCWIKATTKLHLDWYFITIITKLIQIGIFRG